MNMLRFNNDYNHGAHPAILQALQETNDTAFGGYGMDEVCEAAKEAIQQYLQSPCSEIHFLVGGTQANYTVIASILRPYQSVLAAETGHIAVHETGAVEHTGHKVETLPQKDGKITAAQIEEAAVAYETSLIPEHITQPGMVYISNPTEFGTIYSKAELEEISRVCRAHGLPLFVDGARLGYALGAADNDLTLADLARLTDVFYIGGTKCGALFGEAVVINNPELQKCFRNNIKQNGGMLAKGWLLGLQYLTLFRDGLYFEITKKADVLAMQIKEAFAAKGIPSYIESCTNQQFVILENSQMETLAKNHIFEYDRKIDENHTSVRFCTSWASKQEEIDALTADISRL